MVDYSRIRDEAEKRPGNFLEIGTHVGSSAMILMEELKEDNFLVTVDPWGSKPYVKSNCLYGNDFQREAIRKLSDYAFNEKKNWTHFKMLSLDFLTRIQPCQTWYGGKSLSYDWSLALLDGEHTFETVRREISLLLPFMRSGSALIIDDLQHDGMDIPGMEKLGSQIGKFEIMKVGDRGLMQVIEIF